MRLSLSEIKSRAITFANEWKDETDEVSESQSFINDFFNVFGISRKRVASFEKHVKKLDGKDGYIDLLWKGTLLIEQKSAGKDLNKAYKQAIDYFPGLTEDELPTHILVSDFQRFRLYNLENDKHYDFSLSELHKKIHLFDFISGFKKKEYKDEDPVNIKAAELLGELHDALLKSGYEGHELEVFLVRILFCLFADDTGIFQPHDQFTWFVETMTRIDGSDLGTQLAFLFQLLNTPDDKRQKNLDEELKKFPYVNGKLYSEHLDVPVFDSKMRSLLLKCCHFDWSKISPAIFGSLFQSVMNEKKRRELGAHYTSEKNIMKVVSGLFLDDLKARFEKSKNSERLLKELHSDISKLKFLDPACGCGNFLVITYRELRLLELEILKILHEGQQATNIEHLSILNVDAFYGIEIEEWPARIAEVAMWLLDHQMNVLLSEEFGEYYVRLPLRSSPHVINGNALRMDWESIVKQEELSYILGNPPFVGKHLQNEDQKAEMEMIFSGVHGAGVMDYVASWYIKAAQYIQNTNIEVAFVSTNSITQGEQVSILWSELLNHYKIKIHFAHRTFKWSNEARGKAAVFCVIIGFANFDIDKKYIYEYENVNSEPHVITAKNINPYLVDFEDLIIPSRNHPICNVPEMIFGNKSVDDGNFMFTKEEKNEFLNEQPESSKFFRPILSAKEFLNNEERWCLWLKNIKPAEIKSLPKIAERIENVKKFRLKSKKAPTRESANYAYLFAEIRQPESDYVVIPRVSSENRKYVPMGFFSNNYILSDSCIGLPNATLYDFGIITSAMHMAWMRQVCGRLKSDYRYSNALVYNNFPWPQQVPIQKKKNVEEKARKILRVREQFPESSLADLYDPLSMPKELVKAHDDLDRAVDSCYTNKDFPTELSRIEFLFDLYKKYTEPLLGGKKKKRGKK